MPDQTLTGTPWRDVLDVGTSSVSYLIDGLGGSDAMTGGSGNDVLDGGAGDDQMNGGAGDDVFRVTGAQGLDRIHGGTGHDVVLGSGGDDIIGLYEISGIESIDGGGGNDVIAGSDWRDTLDFSTSALTGIGLIDGAGGSDVLTGSAGDDRMRGGGGHDQMDGGAGTDTAAYGGVYSGYVISILAGGDLSVSGEGTDTLNRIEVLEFADGTWRDGVFSPFVDPDNTAPTAGTGTAATDEDQAVTLDALALANDPDGDPLTVTAASAGAGTVDIQADGSLLYTPFPDVNGDDIVAFTVEDGRGGRADGSITVSVAPVADAPVAADDAATSTGGAPATVDLLANDSDPDGETVTLDSVGQPGAGVLTVGSGGEVTWDPGGFLGTTSATYSIIDPTGRTASATLFLEAVPAVSTVTLTGTDYRDTLDARGQTAPHIIDALGGSDILYGGDAGDTLSGGAGDDQMDGGAGDDAFTMSGDTGDLDRIHGGTGIDSILGSGGNDVIGLYELSGIEVIDGGGGNDVIAGSGWRDTLDFSAVSLTGIGLIDGANGSDLLTGSAGDDHLRGGGGDDNIDGGAGNDTAVYDGTFASYGVSVLSGGSIRVTGDGTDTLNRIEVLAFSDGTWQDGVFSGGSGGGGGGGGTAPVAQDDAATVIAGQSVTIDVLANDSDADGDSLAVTSVTAAGSGTVVINADGSVTYSSSSSAAGTTDTFDYTITDTTGLTATATVTCTINENDGGGGSTPPGALADKLKAIPEGGWGRLNENFFSDVWVTGTHAATRGTADAVIEAWSSMAWDGLRDDLIFWGGGHANYNGNEIYRWDADTMMWESASLPSAVQKPPNYTGTLPYFEAVDGVHNAPISSHTYDNNGYLEGADRFFTMGGASYNTGSQFVEFAADGSMSPTGPYFWNPALADPNKVGGTTGSHVNATTGDGILGGEMWENRDVGVWNDVQPTSFTNGATAVAKEAGADVVYVSSRPGRSDALWKYTVTDVNDPTTDTWQIVGGIGDAYSGAGSAAFDPGSNLFVRTAGQDVVFWDLNQSGTPKSVIATIADPTGTFGLDALWGMDYDPVRDTFVLWDGEGAVWTMAAPDDPYGSWTPQPVAPTTATPDVPPSTFTGVLGKWKYVDDYDVFLGVTDHVDGDIWAWKPSGWTGGDIAVA